MSFHDSCVTVTCRLSFLPFYSTVIQNTGFSQGQSYHRNYSAGVHQQYSPLHQIVYLKKWGCMTVHDNTLIQPSQFSVGIDLEVGLPVQFGAAVFFLESIDASTSAVPCQTPVTAPFPTSLPLSLPPSPPC